MGTSAIILLATTAFFAIRGYFNGTWASIARTVAFIGAYGTAFYFSKHAALQVKQNTPIEGIAAYLVGGISLFIVTMVAIRLIFWVIAKMTPGSDRKPSTASRFGGLLISGSVGAFIGLILVYLLGIYSEAKTHNAETITQPSQSTDQVANIAKATVSKSVGAIMTASGADKSSVQLSESFIANPVESVDRITRVTNNPDLQALLKDRRSQRLLKQGDIDELMKVPEFRRLMNNQDMRELMASSGMDVNSQDSAQETAQKIAVAWQRIESMKSDPRVQKIVQDPEFQRKLESDNKLSLLTSPEMNELAGIIFVEGAGSVGIIDGHETVEVREMNRGSDAEASDGTVYRYVDEDGNVRYSDRPVNNNN